jgi:hypothetical protein
MALNYHLLAVSSGQMTCWVWPEALEEAVHDKHCCWVNFPGPEVHALADSLRRRLADSPPRFRLLGDDELKASHQLLSFISFLPLT